MSKLIILTCRKCGRGKKIDIEKYPNWKQLIWKCKNCESTKKGYEWDSPESEPTTIYGSPYISAESSQGQLRNKLTNKVVALKEGITELGRDLLNPDDKAISRTHAAIDTKKTSRGLQHIFYDTGAKNPTKINGSKIDKGDKILLHEGDILLFGHGTEYIFEGTDSKNNSLNDNSDTEMISV